MPRACVCQAQEFSNASKPCLPRDCRNGPSLKTKVEAAPFEYQVDGCLLLPAVEDLRDVTTVRGLKRHHADSPCFSSGLHARCTWPHKLTEVRQVVISSRVRNLVRALVDDDHRMLHIGIGVSVDG